jgi:hypothetical protein
MAQGNTPLWFLSQVRVVSAFMKKIIGRAFCRAFLTRRFAREVASFLSDCSIHLFSTEINKGLDEVSLHNRVGMKLIRRQRKTYRRAHFLICQVCVWISPTC